MTDQLYLLSSVDEIGPYVSEVFLDSTEAYSEELADRQTWSSMSLWEETLIEATEQDGCWIMTTELTDADRIRSVIEYDASSAGVEPAFIYADGMSLIMTYVFDGQTKDLLENRNTLREADGKEHLYTLDKYTYGLEYDAANSLFAPYFETTEFSTYHLVFAPGTPEESTMTYLLPKDGIYFAVIYQGEYYQGGFYTDPECTQAYEGGLPRPDEVTLYIPAQG